MKYEKPKCECGQDLVYYRERPMGEYFQIIPSGELNLKNPVIDYIGTPSRMELKCTQCDNHYALWLNPDRKLMRGEKIPYLFIKSWPLPKGSEGEISK